MSADPTRAPAGPTAGEDWGSPSALGWALRFTAGQATAIDEAALAHLGANDWTWAHYRLGDVRAQAMLKARSDLPPGIRALFMLRDDRIFLGQDDDWTFGVLPDVERDLGGAPQAPSRLVFAVNGRRLMTGRLHALRSVDDVRHGAEHGALLEGPGEAIRAVIESYANVVESMLDESGRRLGSIEDYVLTEPPDPRHSGLSAERRRVARLGRELTALRSALVRAQGGRQGERVELVAAVLPELISLVEDVEREAAGLQERGRLLHEEIDTLINAATNRGMRILAVISTLLVPPTLITGAFGMNVPGLPWHDSPAGFALASAVCVATVVGALWLLRRLQML
jgi:zinc transporter